ncbi:sugar phosphate nucleotidyltransferase [Nonomuraea antimicrobica]
MACGAPVLTTHRTSLPEVGGDAVAYTEPDADSIATALGHLLASPSAGGSCRKPGWRGPANSPGTPRRRRTSAPINARSNSSVTSRSDGELIARPRGDPPGRGQGTRLRPLTLGTPKPLLPTAGVPFLAHQLARARAFGVRRIVFATSYKASMFEPAFGDGAAFGLSLHYMTEETPLGTGGAIRNAAEALTVGPDDPVLILNGDILSGHDIGEQIHLHREREAAVTLHLTEVDDPTRFGCVPTDEAGRVTAFLEKTPNPVTNRINAGCYVFTRSVIDSIPRGEVVSVERQTFPGLIESGRLVLGYPDRTYWLDVGTPAAFVQGSRDLVLGRLASPALPGPTGEYLALPGARVSPEAKVGAARRWARGPSSSRGPRWSGRC